MRVCPERKRALQLLKKVKAWFAEQNELAKRHTELRDIQVLPPSVVELERLLRTHKCRKK